MNHAGFGIVILAAASLYLMRRNSTPAAATTSGDLLSSFSNAFQDAGSALLTLGPYIGAGTSEDQRVLAQTIWGEARGLGRDGMENVASVVMNRYNQRRQGKGYPSFGPVNATIAQICKAPAQFSCWNSNDPNLPLMVRATAADPVYAMALDVAGDAITGNLFDRTGGADHYFASSIAAPSWARGVATIFEDVGHTFKRLIG